MGTDVPTCTPDRPVSNLESCRPGRMRKQAQTNTNRLSPPSESPPSAPLLKPGPIKPHQRMGISVLPLTRCVCPRIRQKNSALGVEGRPQSCRFGTRSGFSHRDSFANPKQAASALSRRTQNGGPNKKQSICPPEWMEMQLKWEQLFTQNDENSSRQERGGVDTLN